MRIPEERSQPPIEVWLRRELARAHDAVLRETLPEELLRLLDQRRTA